MILIPKKALSGLTFLNVGCGSNYHSEWNNVDLFPSDQVIFHDLRQPLPFREEIFDAVYCSHVLEHFSQPDGGCLIQEMYRVLKPGGVSRLAVPDLEGICEEYLKQLRAAAVEPSLRNRRRYHWIKLELLDQMVREQSGGQMIQTLEAGDFDREFVEYRNGDQFSGYYQSRGTPHNPESLSKPGIPPGPPSLIRKLARKGPWAIIRAMWRRIRPNRHPELSSPPPKKDFRSSGELHKWMYDRVSLKFLLEEHGYVNFRVCRFDESKIPDWDRYQLDQSTTGHKPRKPDSLFVEAVKPLLVPRPPLHDAMVIKRLANHPVES